MILEALYAKTKDNGFLILVEPGSPKGFRFIHDFRKWALEK
jgi:ribosomal protein RSM22 (predicted rRNA methylase)